MKTYKNAFLSMSAKLGLALLLATTAMVTLLVLVALAAPGDLDPTFDGDGKVTTDFGAPYGEIGEAIAVQPDGKIVVAGHARISALPPNRDFAVARYEISGTLDPTFGAGGLAVTDLGSGGDEAHAVAIQPDGKIVVAGASGGDFALVRYEISGTLDATFGTGGIATTDLNVGGDSARAVAIQSDGKIVAVGYSSDDFALARYETNGALDTTFGTSGVVTTDFGSGNDGGGRAVAIQQDGKIIVAGYARDGSYYGFALARYGVSGALDTTFGTSGVHFFR